MKKVATLMLFVATFSLLSCTTSTGKARNNLQNKNLKGAVKFLTEKTFLEKNPKSKRNETQKLLTTTVSLFNPNGNVTEEKHYDLRNNLTEKVVFRYDAQNHIIDESHYSSNGICKNRFTYHYNNQGNPNEKDCTYPANWKNKLKFIFRYNRKGYLVRDGWCLANNQFGVMSVYLHDANGFLTEREINDPTDHLWRRYIYKYDSQGNTTEINNYKSDGTVNGRFTYSYTFDKIGNWVSQITYIDNTKKSTINRKIEYY